MSMSCYRLMIQNRRIFIVYSHGIMQAESKIVLSAQLTVYFLESNAPLSESQAKRTESDIVGRGLSTLLFLRLFLPCLDWE